MSQDAPLRIMSYNIRLNTPADGPNAWPHRQDEVARLILAHGPDAVGLQEALKDQVEDLASSLPGYAWFGLGREGGDRGEYNPVFYRQDRLELRRSATFWLSETPDVVACTGWDAHCPRIVTWGEFRDARGQTFYHFNTHLDHLGERARTESARVLVQTVETVAEAQPAVVTGDFNLLESSSPYAILAERLQDSLRADGTRDGPEGTFFGFEVTEEPGIRIDYVFVSGFRVLAHRTLTDSRGGYYPSDHLPVLVELAQP